MCQPTRYFYTPPRHPAWPKAPALLQHGIALGIAALFMPVSFALWPHALRFSAARAQHIQEGKPLRAAKLT